MKFTTTTALLVSAVSALAYVQAEEDPCAGLIGVYAQTSTCGTSTDPLSPDVKCRECQAKLNGKPAPAPGPAPASNESTSPSTSEDPCAYNLGSVRITATHGDCGTSGSETDKHCIACKAKLSGNPVPAPGPAPGPAPASNQSTSPSTPEASSNEPTTTGADGNDNGAVTVSMSLGIAVSTALVAAHLL